MATQLIATYGLSRSPILAAFQKIPKNLRKAREHSKTKGGGRGGEGDVGPGGFYPCLFLSSTVGIFSWR